MLALARFAALIAVRRTAADWRLQAAAGFGMVLAVALMASGVIYSRALEETALRHALRNASDEAVNLSVRVFHALERPAFEATSRFVEERVHRPLSPHLQGSTLLIQTSTLYFSGLSQPEPFGPDRPRVSLQAITNLADHVLIVEGRLPGLANGELEVVIDRLGATVLDLPVGTLFNVFPATGGDQAKPLPVRVVGVIEPLEPSGQYWQIGPWDRFTSTERQWIALPLYADMDALFDTTGMAFPGLHTDFIWLFPLDREGLRASQVHAVRATLLGAVDGLRSNLPNSSWKTELGDVLKRYTSLLVLARIPLFLVVFLAMGVLLYYLFLIAGLMGRVRAPEVALFRSRGASTPQVGVVILVEGLLMAVPAIVAGPFMAQALVVVTGRLFPAASVEQGLVLVELSVPVFLLGAVGALVAVAVFAATTLISARKGVVALFSSSARPPETPFLHRYYLDVVLLVLIGIVWWQLKSRGSFLVQPLAGESMELDMTLLLGPVLGLVAAGLLLLRFFPIALKILVRPAEPFGSVWLVHALRSVARDPVPSGSLMVLLALATALGVLGSAVISTLQRSQRDQALYQAGADVRIRYSPGSQGAAGQRFTRSLERLPEVAAATEVMRLETSVSTAAMGREVTLLAVDPEAFPRVAWTRADFTDGPLADVLQSVSQAGGSVEGILLPADATDLGIWVQAGRVASRTTLNARIQDGQGTYFDMALGDVTGRGWNYLEAPIQPPPPSRRYTPPSVEPPYHLRTLWINTRGRSSGGVFFDQLQAITPEGPVEVESFQDVEGWHPLEDPSAPGLYSLETSQSVARPERRSAVLTWGAGGMAQRGIRAGPPETFLPVLVSDNFLEVNQVQHGDTLSVYVGSVPVPVKIVRNEEFFPTLDPRQMPFMVADLSPLGDYVALHGQRPTYPGTEAWVRFAGDDLSTGNLSQAIIEEGGSVFETFEAASMVAELTGDPLLAAGWSGLLALSFLAVVLATSSGLILYSYIDARERQGEFAILQTLGFTSFQVNGVLWFNLGLTVVVGLGLGTLGGHWLGRAILPLLEVAEGGARVTPPMVLETNWLAVGISYLVLAAATGVTVVALAWAISRLEVQRLLRVADA
ncbi:MAG: FtsX-like permease family protein [Dehalococcoidia bacterium]